jgi:hypothetical protein
MLEPWDEDDDEFNGCDHGVWFDEECLDCEEDCLMPGIHLRSECCTAEMMEDCGLLDIGLAKEGEEIAPNINPLTNDSGPLLDPTSSEGKAQSTYK